MHGRLVTPLKAEVRERLEHVVRQSEKLDEDSVVQRLAGIVTIGLVRRHQGSAPEPIEDRRRLIEFGFGQGPRIEDHERRQSGDRQHGTALLLA